MALESTRRSESSPEPGSQAERRLNSTLSIPFILPLTMRCRWLRVARESAQDSRGRGVAVLKRTSLRERGNLPRTLSVSLKRRQAWLMKMNMLESQLNKREAWN